MSTPRWWWLLQLAASLAVIGALIGQAEPEQLAALPARLSLGWMAAALGLKVLTLLFHEARTWLALPAPRPPLVAVTRLGLAAGVLNLILPGRAGDVAVIVLLRRLCQVPIAAGTAAMTLVSFLEAAVFGIVLLAVLMLGRWEGVLGAQALQDATRWVSLGALAAVLFAVIIAVIGRALDRQPAPTHGGLVVVLREATRQTGLALSRPGPVLLHTSAALVQVVGMVAAFAMALPAVGLDVPMPWLAAAGVLALSSLASTILPPTYGAGPAAASATVLPVFGADPVSVLAYAGAWWIISQVPASALGLPCMWSLGLKPADIVPTDNPELSA